jgi:hypothetical protein
MNRTRILICDPMAGMPLGVLFIAKNRGVILLFHILISFLISLAVMSLRP